MKYCELKKINEKEFNDFPKFYAFSQNRFNEGMISLGLQPEETHKIYSIGGGGYIRRSDSKALNELMKKLDKRQSELVASDTTGEGFIYDMFRYELSNHEYIITREIDDTLDALGYTIEDINNNKNLRRGLIKACKDIVIDYYKDEE